MLNWLETLTEVRYYNKKHSDKVSKKIQRRDVTWRHFWFWRQKCADVCKNVRTKPQFYYDIHRVSSIMFQTFKGSTVLVRQLEAKLSWLKKCQFFSTTSLKYDVTMTSYWIFWRHEKFIRHLSFVPSSISLAHHQRSFLKVDETTPLPSMANKVK